MIDSEGGLLNGSHGAVQGCGGLKPILPRAALIRSSSVRQRRNTGRTVSGLVTQPVRPAEPLFERSHLRKMAADPGNWDLPHKQGPKVSIRPMQQVRHVVLLKGIRTVTNIPGVRDQVTVATATTGPDQGSQLGPASRLPARAGA